MAPWWEERGLDGLSRGERQYIEELKATRESIAQGTDAINRQLERSEGQLRSEIRTQGKALQAAHVASTKAIIQTLDSGFNQVAGILTAGFYSLEWRLDALLQFAQRITFALEHPRQTEARELVQRGLYAFKQGWWEDARQDLTEARQVHRYDPVPWLYGGKILFWIDGDVLTANEIFAEAARYGAPINGRVAAEAFLERAHIRVLQGNTGEAAGFSEKAVDLDGDNHQVLAAAARVHVLAGSTQRAVEYATKAIDLVPTTVVMLAADWTAPIRPAVEYWAKEIHLSELGEIRPKYQKLSDARRYLVGRGALDPKEKDVVWEQTQEDISNMSLGFLDLRLRREAAENRRVALVARWKEQALKRLPYIPDKYFSQDSEDLPGKIIGVAIVSLISMLVLPATLVGLGLWSEEALKEIVEERPGDGGWPFYFKSSGILFITILASWWLVRQVREFSASKKRRLRIEIQDYLKKLEEMV